MMLVSIIH